MQDAFWAMRPTCVEWSPDYAHRFRAEQRRLYAEAFPPHTAYLEHFGSTSVPMLPGKGIVDIWCTQHTGTANQDSLRALGYRKRHHAPEGATHDRYDLVDAHGAVCVCLHVSPLRRNNRLERYLRHADGRAHRELYAATKRQLCDQAPSMEQYRRGKQGVLETISRAAAEWAARDTFIVTGSSGRLGAALCAALGEQWPDASIWGVDVRPGGAATTHLVGELDALMERVDEMDRRRLRVLHAGALHKPQVATHAESEFVRLNVLFTQQLLERCASLERTSLEAFVFTSTTSVYGSLYKSDGSATCWIDETVEPAPKNIYGWSKIAAEGLVRLYAARLPDARFAVLRACRFFPENDDNSATGCSSDFDAQRHQDALKLMHALTGRRLTLRDVVDAHLAALQAHDDATCPVVVLANATRLDAADGDVTRELLLRRYPGLALLAERGWPIPQHLDRVYVGNCARLDWQPRDTPDVLCALAAARKALPW